MKGLPLYYMVITLSHQLSPSSVLTLKLLKYLGWGGGGRNMSSFHEMIHKFQPVTKGLIAHVPFAHDLTQSFSVLPKQTLL